MNAVLLLAAVVVRTAIVLAAVGAGIRFINKRHVGEMRLHDILFVLLAANAVQNAMTSGSGKLSVAVAGAATLMFAGWFVAVLFDWSRRAKRLGGTPVVLVHHGTLVRRNLRRQQIAEDELTAAIREQGLLRLADVKLAVLETNGSISVVPKEHAGS